MGTWTAGPSACRGGDSRSLKTTKAGERLPRKCETACADFNLSDRRAALVRQHPAGPVLCPAVRPRIASLMGEAYETKMRPQRAVVNMEE